MTTIFSGMFAQVTFGEALKAKGKELGPSSGELKLDYCNQCMHCCWKRPGEWAGPENLAQTAALMNMAPEAFFKAYCVVDDLHGEITVVPRRVEQADVAGTMLTSERTFDFDTPCVFLDTEKKECKVHAAKPQSCAVFKCWEPQQDQVVCGWTQDDIKALGWDGDLYPEDY